MMLTKLRNLLLILILLSFSQVSFADTQFRILTGTKQQTFGTSSQVQLGTSPLGLIAFVDLEVAKKIYFSFGTSFEMSTEDYTTSGFSVYASGMYYIYGSPKVVNSNTGSMNMDLYYPYSVFLSGGVFQKEIKLTPSDTAIEQTKGLGGPMVGLGFNYNLNPRTYVASHVQMLMSGIGSASEYSSTEFYVGLGLRL